MGRGRLIAALIVFLVMVGAIWGFIAYRGIQPQLGLDLQGGVSITLIPAPGQDVSTETLDQTVDIIRQRVDGLGVAEPEIARQGDTIEVQLPGVTDQQRAQDVIGRTAQLQFRPVQQIVQPGTPEHADLGPPCDQTVAEVPPPDEVVVICGPSAVADLAPTGEEEPPDQRAKYELGPVAVSGEQVADASAALDPSSQWIVNLSLEGDGAAAFQEVTGTLACAPVNDPTRQLAIVLDGLVRSAPPMDPGIICNEGIPDGNAIITSGGGEDEARELALVLRTGALPVQLDFATSQSVSPTLGRESLDAGLLAGGLGLLLVAAYLLVLYKGVGLAAIAELLVFGALSLGLILLLGEYAGFTLTLAGIAGLIVSVGTAADSSIIYRERFRDELRAGRTVRTAADHAFTNAWRTNLTGNAVSLLAALVLYFLAVGPVRGFAFTLGLSTIVDTLIFATFTRSLLGLIARTPRLARSRFMGLNADILAARTVPARSSRKPAARQGAR